METVKKVLAGLVVAISVIGIAFCLVGIFYSWSLNTPVTQAIERALSGVEQFLTLTGEGMERVQVRLDEADTAVTTVEDAVVGAGETINQTNIAFEIVDRTVGDTLFPKIEQVAETVGAITNSVVTFNETLEAVNQIPFVEVPTLTTRLENVSTRVEETRTEVQATRAELQAIKEENVARPVNAITDRTTRISDGLNQLDAGVGEVQNDVDNRLQEVSATKAKVARTIDLISLAATIVLLWLILAQAGLILLGLGMYKGQDPLLVLKTWKDGSA